MREGAGFAAYVEAAEARIGAASDARLRAAYDFLKSRFKHDLGAGRDELVSRAGALMLAEALFRETARSANAGEGPGALSVEGAALAVAFVSLHDGM